MIIGSHEHAARASAPQHRATAVTCHSDPTSPSLVPGFLHHADKLRLPRQIPDRNRGECEALVSPTIDSRSKLLPRRSAFHPGRVVLDFHPQPRSICMKWGRGGAPTLIGSRGVSPTDTHASPTSRARDKYWREAPRLMYDHVSSARWERAPGRMLGPPATGRALTRRKPTWKTPGDAHAGGELACRYMRLAEGDVPALHWGARLCPLLLLVRELGCGQLGGLLSQRLPELRRTGRWMGGDNAGQE